MSSVSAVSGTMDIRDMMANSATNMKTTQVQQAVQSAVLKQTMDQEKVMGEALVEMINNTPTAGATGSLVDIKV